MKKMLIIVGIGVIVVVAGFFALNSYIYNEKQGDGASVEPYQATLTGTYVCLPHKEAVATKECAPGIKTDTGEYYALTFALMSQTPPTIRNGERFIASGVITPIENIRTDEWQKYDVEGIFSVTNGVEIEREPVVTPTPSTPGKCYVGGCSSQLCTSEPNMASTCEYREAYACYHNQICERQASGECGWTLNAEAVACLETAE